jgi:hypothetical protein
VLPILTSRLVSREGCERINDGRLLLDVTARCIKKKKYSRPKIKKVSSQSVKDAILIRNKKFS